LSNEPLGLSEALYRFFLENTDETLARFAAVIERIDTVTTRVSEALDKSALVAERVKGALEKEEQVSASIAASVSQLDTLATRIREAQDQSNTIAETYALLVRQQIPAQQKNADTLAENTAALNAVQQDVHSIKALLSPRDVMSELRDSIEQAFWADLTNHTSKERELLIAYISGLQASEAKAFQEELAHFSNGLAESLAAAYDANRGKPALPLPVHGHSFGARMNAILGSAIIRIQRAVIEVQPLATLLLCALIAYRKSR
jgi:hypothetical protein